MFYLARIYPMPGFSRGYFKLYFYPYNPVNTTMKSKLIMLLVCTMYILAIKAQTVEVSASEPDANIIVDGQRLGTGSLKIKVLKNAV